MREWNIDSNDNALFVTSQCNNRCIMCCQPPYQVNDIDQLYERNMDYISRAPEGIDVLGITGGEPTLLGDKLFSLIEAVRKQMPSTAIHILSNGRKFADNTYAKMLKEVGGDKIFLGIPLHSDYPKDHDFISGVKGAYEETLLGLYNLSSCGMEIELRIVVNSINYNRLPQIAGFIYRNLPFVGWVAFMGMEHTGFAVKNEDRIWIEPKDYSKQLEAGVIRLTGWGIDTAIYNIPHCLLPKSVWQFAKRSISDWKVKYTDACEDCCMKTECCGLFGTSRKEYKGLTSI